MPTKWIILSFVVLSIDACSELPMCLLVSLLLFSSCIFFPSGFSLLPHEVFLSNPAGKFFGSRFPLPEKIFMSPFLLDDSIAGCQVLDWQLLSICEDLFAFSLAPVAARSLLYLVNPCSLWLLLRSSLCLWSAALFRCPMSRCIPTPRLTSFCLELTVLQPKDVCLSSLLENSFNCRFKYCLFGAAG